jgi:heptosyltransferase-1
MRRLLVVRLGSLGDLVHTLPAVSAIRRGTPGLEIDWLVDGMHRDFLDLVPILNGIVPLQDRTVGAWLRARRELRRRRYDVAIDFQGLLKSAALARLSGAKRVVGFERRALRERTAAPFYTERIDVGEGIHVVEKNMRLARAAGAQGTTLEFPIAEVSSAVVTDFVRAHAGPLALVNPGAAWPNKRWPPDRFGAICRALRERHQLTPVVLWGPGEDAMAAEVVAASGGAAIAAPATRVPELVALARHARLVVSGDTGPLHIAAALGVPAVALFGPTDPRRNGPWHSADVAISRYDRCDCHYERRCRRDPGRWCLGTISVDDVIKSIDERRMPRV